MGVTGSIPSYSEDDTDIKFDLQFPEDIIVHIFSYLSTKDLKNCALVCKQWKRVIDRNTLWKLKCLKENIKIPPDYVVFKLTEVGQVENLYRNIYLKKPYARNLIQNQGERGLKYWAQDKFNAETNLVEPPEEDDSKIFSDNDFCFASSYAVCEKSQEIDFVRCGINPLILEQYQPPITIRDWHAARFDCGCLYNLQVKLKDSADKVLDSFNFAAQYQQWEGRPWQKVEHTFRNYPKGVRKLTFYHSGKDTHFWIGHYGSKVAASSVIIDFEDSKEI